MPAIALHGGTASRNRASRALRLRSPRETPLRSDTDVLLVPRLGSEPEQRIRRTSSQPGPTRKTTYYAARCALVVVATLACGIAESLGVRRHGVFVVGVR